MKLHILVAIFCNSSIIVAGFMDVDLAAHFFKSRSLQSNIILVCALKNGQMAIARKINAGKDTVTSVKHIKYLNVLSNLVMNYRRVGIALDGDCLETPDFLLRCRKYKVFDTKHFWLIQYNSSSYQNLFANVSLNVDSEVKVAFPVTKSDMLQRKYAIDDVYNSAFEKGGVLKFSRVGLYTIQTGYQIFEVQNKYFLRRNLTGVHFSSVIALPEPFDEPLQNYMVNDKNVEVNTLNRFHARLMQYCTEYYNFSVSVGVTKSWGFFKPDGTMDGVVGALEKKKADFGMSPLIAKVERAKFISYGKGTWPLRMAFMFRNPNKKKSYEIFVKPLSTQIWIAIILSSWLLTLAHKLSYGFHKQDAKENIDRSWGVCVIRTLGAFCQQAMSDVPSKLSGKITVFVTLTLGLLVYQFYSSILVSFLLNVPVRIITNIQGILDHGFNIGYENVLYSRSLLEVSTDPITKEIYRRVLANNKSGFLSRDVGMNLMKEGHYAFHIELVTAYPFIRQHFDEAMICELREILLFPSMFMYANYQKWSPVKDIMDVCLQRLEENGVLARELLFWQPRKPECVRSALTMTISSGLEDLYPAWVVLLVGIALSLLILLKEIYVHHFKSRNVILSSQDKVFTFTK